MDYSSLSNEELLKLAEEAKIDVKKDIIEKNLDIWNNPKLGKIYTICGDSLKFLKTCPDNHFDSVVTDPPYGLSFMGK